MKLNLIKHSKYQIIIQKALKQIIAGDFYIFQTSISKAQFFFFQKSIYLREPTGIKKAVEENKAVPNDFLNTNLYGPSAGALDAENPKS